MPRCGRPEYLFNQLIPYIGNKRKLLRLIHQAIQRTRPRSEGTLRRFLRRQRRRVAAGQTAGLSRHRQRLGAVRRRRSTAATSPATGRRRLPSLGGYEQADRTLEPPAAEGRLGDGTSLSPRRRALRHRSATACSTCASNGMRIDAIREQIAAWKDAGRITDVEEACLLAPLVYQACYRSNTSGVFKGFHNGWGGQTKTALYRIATDLRLDVPVFCDNGRENLVFREDAQTLAERLSRGRDRHCVSRSALQSASLRQQLSRAQQRRPVGQAAAEQADHPRHEGGDPRSTGGPSAAARTTTGTRPAAAYRRLLDAINARYILTSYSTDGTIPLGRPAAEQRRAGARFRGDAGLQALSRQLAAILEEADERRVRLGARYASQERCLGGRTPASHRPMRDRGAQCPSRVRVVGRITLYCFASRPYRASGDQADAEQG